MKRNWLIALAFTLLAFLAPFVGAQEQTSEAKKPSIDVKDLPRLFDPKKLDDSKAAAAAIEQIEAAFQSVRQPEAVRMLIDILRGSQMGGDSGWFGPADTRYTLQWLAARSGADPTKGVPRGKFSGPDAWFTCLDRNKDGLITSSDLDWGKLKVGGKVSGTPPGGGPSRSVLIKGLFEGEIGSMQVGPQLEHLAPDFTLKTVDGKSSVQFSKLIGPRPVVLVLGNYTCGPFRTFYTTIEGMYERYKNDATFLMVYVREAHPTDGWKMESNTRAGVAVKQPTTLSERTAVASQFCEKLKPTMPVVVDEISDPVGHAYSGMPGQVYVIDAQGKVAYKSGRGPFGFRAGEMEQAIVMALLEQMATKSK